jgi:oligopeptide transport system ATP-binding protein
MRRDPLLHVDRLSVHFPVETGFLQPRAAVHAVEDVSFELAAGETLGVVGESGCGKSTLGRAVLNLMAPTSGRILWQGHALARLSPGQQRMARRDMTMIFQDPLASLNPRMTFEDLVAEPLDIFEAGLAPAERRRRVAGVLERVGLPVDAAKRYPHQFSGGQCQRIGIARALVMKPKMIVCDEVVSALDVSVQAQIVALLDDLSRDMGVALLFISHNLAVVRQISDRILVLYLGKVMEIADRDSLYHTPRHPYTQALLSAVPVPDPDLERTRRRIRLVGELPSPLNPPKGCVFHTRCRFASDRCRSESPALGTIEAMHSVACHHWQQIARAGEAAAPS